MGRMRDDPRQRVKWTILHPVLYAVNVTADKNLELTIGDYDMVGIHSNI